MASRRKLFISYSHGDAVWLQKLQIHLKPLEREGTIEAWADTRMNAGDRWQEEIRTALAEAYAAILLVSPNFYASDYITEQELPPLLKQAEQRRTRILILVINPCRYQRDVALSCFQAAHDPSKALSEMPDPEQHRVFDKLVAQLEADLKSSLQSDADDSSSHPMTIIPVQYEPRRPVTPPLFVGRRKQLQELGRELDRNNSISLVGDWRIGKSSLLATWAIEARKRGREVISVSGEDGVAASLAAFVGAITGNPTSNEPDPAADVLESWARRHAMPPLILVDEAGHLLRTIEKRFWSRVRGMLDRACWVFATRVELREISPDSPLVNRLGLIRLGLLDSEAAESLVMIGGLDRARQDIMREWAGRHAFYLQLLGRYLADAADHHVAVDDFIDEARNRLNEVFSILSPTEQVALRATAEGRSTPIATLRRRGLVDEAGKPFGRVLSQWLLDQN